MIPVYADPYTRRQGEPIAGPIAAAVVRGPVLTPDEERAEELYRANGALLDAELRGGKE